MSRHDETAGGSKNPATLWLEWKSDKKSFQFYDKEKKEEVTVPIPMKLIFLKQMTMVKGWDSHNECRLYSNEVTSTAKEELTVKSYKGGNLVTGLWKDIKGKVDSLGGSYHRSIYFIDEQGEIINVQLRGAAVKAWFDFYQDNRKQFTKNFILVTGSLADKKGAVKFNVPVFEIGDELDSKSDKKAEEIYETLKLYIDSYKDAKEVDKVNAARDEGVKESEDDDLPF